MKNIPEALLIESTQKQGIGQNLVKSKVAKNSLIGQVKLNVPTYKTQFIYNYHVNKYAVEFT